VRNAIAQYDETAPLYGFLRYRRRNVIIKYLPEECSRLVQGLCSLLKLPFHIAGGWLRSGAGVFDKGATALFGVDEIGKFERLT